ncbi:MAG TPA: M20/M25/M40 family metallo-hydrolase, partial [Magnetospirillaceae bacterium]|nr:M20/M25/M40 family metallo-hydrolase [Magnetospirillaceae bacterium]
MTPPARILRDLIRIRSDTGSDMEPVVGYAADFLKRRGLDVHLFNFGGGAPCMVARLPGRTRGVPRPLLALYCHLDTAAFDASGWRTDPLGAAVLRGRIFGRGAVDCKGLAAVWMSLLAGRASGGPDLPFDTALVAVTDEEVQGNAGLEALLDRTAELEGAFLALSEGGGFPLNACGRRYYTVQTGEMDELAPGMDGRPLRPPAFPAALAAGFRLGAFTAETLGYRVRVFLGGGGERRLAHPPFA